MFPSLLTYEHALMPCEMLSPSTPPPPAPAVGAEGWVLLEGHLARDENLVHVRVVSMAPMRDRLLLGVEALPSETRCPKEAGGLPWRRVARVENYFPTLATGSLALARRVYVSASENVRLATEALAKAQEEESAACVALEQAHIDLSRETNAAQGARL